MSNEIVHRLLKDRKKIDYLKESMALYEAEKDEEGASADEEYLELNQDDKEEESEEDIPEEGDSEEVEDDSTAPEQGSPDDPIPSSSGSSLPDFGGGDTPEEEEPEPEKESKPKDVEEYDNPLDNQYAVHFTLGDEISLTYEGDTQEVPREGVIDGYDTEGFYRVKWTDGTTTNGLTDIALEELVKVANECVCGGTQFVNESNKLVCDKCGRLINEGATLLSADKNRPKGKKLIRSEAHPMSTAVKPSIAEAIKQALKKDKVSESIEDDNEESNVFDRLKQNLDNEFWTRPDELKRDIEELGYTVEEINGEYVIVSHEDDEENVYQIFLGGTSRTMTLDFSRARML